MAGEGPSSKNAVYVKLDLYNFDTFENKNSRYILTSPRSLRACSRLGIKPVELLPQTLEEFSVSSKGLGLKQGLLTTVYQESERLRQRKLQAARREREKIVSEERSGTRETRSGTKLSGPRNDGSDGAGRVSSIKGVIPTAALTDKDQRLLEAMVGHMAEEERLTAQRERAAWVWHVEREQEKREREEREMAHQKRVADSQRRFKKQVDNLKQVHRSLLEEEERERQLQYDAKWGRWSQSAQLQANQRAQKIQAKKHNELLKKSLQEQRLRELEAEENFHQQTVREHLSWLESRAAANRDNIIETEIKEKQLRRESERARHEKKREELAAQTREEQELLQASVAERHKQAVGRYHAQCELRRSFIKQAGDIEAKRLAECKLRSEMMEDELLQWRQEVDTYQRHSMNKAGETAQELLESRRQELQARRMKREREQQDNIRLRQMEELERRAQYAAEMEMKRERSEAILKERETTIQKSREVAGASAKLRDQVKDHYLRNSFDRMAQRAEMQAALEKRQPKTLANPKNVSMLILS